MTLAITGLALYHAQKNPLWISLWACYFITLFPTLGFIQVGIHAMAVAVGHDHSGSGAGLWADDAGDVGPLGSMILRG